MDNPPLPPNNPIPADSESPAPPADLDPSSEERQDRTEDGLHIFSPSHNNTSLPSPIGEGLGGEAVGGEALPLTILKQYWGYDSFRGIQQEIIDNIMSGRDTLGLMPTGGGKSITFQVPAIAKPGVAIVITPLIALMNDQVAHLRKAGIVAASINASMRRSQIVTTLDNCILGNVKLLYISPERIGSELFQKKLKRIDVSFITVDEAHCISQWGYDFRPSYLHIADIRRIKPQAPILALTATATPKVADDIQRQLHFAEDNIVKMSFERPNLRYIVRHDDDKYGKLREILTKVHGAAIVYVGSRKKTREIAEKLKADGIDSTYYHAGLEYSDKNRRQEQWQQGETRVIVATNAFGMGIDKPDVRLVVHYDCPDSIEAYFQEAGRAGRDGKTAYAVLISDGTDMAALTRRVSERYPEKQYIRQVYEHLASYCEVGIYSGRGWTYTFDMQQFCVSFHHYPTRVRSALQLLGHAGYLLYDADPDIGPRVKILLGHDQLSQLHQLSPHEEQLADAMLRSYSGLFTEYVNIEETLLAQRTQLPPDTVHQLLKSLSHQRIIHYIPRITRPLVTWLRDRQPATELDIPPAVYDDQRQRYAQRTAAMRRYATNTTLCRQRLLLDYFHQHPTADCNRCDVCLHNDTHTAARQADSARRQIMTLLADGKSHHITELRQLHADQEALRKTLRQLADEEHIAVDGSMLTLKRK